MLWQEEERCKICAFHPSMRLNLFVPRIVLTTQQVAVSHCKAGKGIIKVNGRPLALVEVTPSPCFFRLSSFCIHSLIAFMYPPSVPHSSLQPPVLRAKLIEPIAVLGLQVTPPPVLFSLCVFRHQASTLHPCVFLRHLSACLFARWRFFCSCDSVNT